MRIIFLLFTLCTPFILPAQAQNGSWTWKSGDSIHHHFHRTGTQGIPSASNFPSARAGAVRWTDGGGNIWMYGGSGFADLWRYDAATEQWTWIRGDNTVHKEANFGSKGMASSNNQPGARSSSTGFTDADGNLWLFGGYYHPPFGGGM